MTKGHWTTRDGRRLKIVEMDRDHIVKTMAMLERDMPDHYEDEVTCADFPDSMSYQQSCCRELGARSYREKIDEFKAELLRRDKLRKK